MQEKTSSELKNKTAESLEATVAMRPQESAEIVRGVNLRRTSGGIPVVRLHYSAHPDRDPETNPEWKKHERRQYTSQASWDREQEIVDEAGGGELVFADVLVTHWDKIVITDPGWRPDPGWRVEAGFDHGRASPTVMLRDYIDYEGIHHFCGEYYQPGLEIWQHARNLRNMVDLDRISDFFADPSIFPTNVQANVPTRPGERAKSINEIYSDNGFDLLAPFYGDRSDVSFAGRLLQHWANLTEQRPTVRIVCRNYMETPQYGLHQWDCPNLIWELMRTRRVKLTAQQLLSRNVSEAIVDKDNHARDASKYILMSHPEPTKKPLQMRVEERIAPIFKEDPTHAMLMSHKIQEEERQRDSLQSGYYGGNIRQRLLEESQKNNR